MRKRTSIVWSISKKELNEVVKNSDSFSKILKYFGLYNKGGNVKTLKRRLNEENIDYSHISLGQNSNIGRKFFKSPISLKKVMIKNSTYNRGALKRRLLKDNILENKCIICNQLPIYNDEKLVMVLDHINGISDDHRLENLRLLCPNCNSQQSTFAGRNGKKKKYNYCEKCKKEINKKSILCKRCSGITRRKVKNRPSQEQLLLEIKELGYCGTGRKYGVSDKAIRKWIVELSSIT